MFQPLQTFSQLLPWTGNIDTDKIVSVFSVHTAFIDPDLFFSSRAVTISSDDLFNTEQSTHTR